MPKDTLFLGEDGRKRRMEGVRKSALAVGSTMGAGGSNATLEKLEYPYSGTTNDGVSILEQIYFEDPLENLGRMDLLQAVSRANKESGDGSSTTTVLTSAILEEGAKHHDASSMEMKESLEACIPIIEKSLKAQTKQVVKNGKVDMRLLEQVATVSSEDPMIGKRIAEIYSKIGADGIVQWEVSKTTDDDYYEIGKGITMHGGTYAHKFMCDMDEKNGQVLSTIKLKNPLILITKQKLNGLNSLFALLQSLMQQGKRELVIFCDEAEAEALDNAAKLRFEARDVNGNPADPFRVVIIRMPVLWRDWWWEDLSQATGAKMVGEEIKLKDARLSHLGSVENITITKEDVILEGLKDLATYTMMIRGDGTDEEAVLRASRLNTQSARYYVGGYSEQAIYHRRFKVEDALATASAALKGGVVAGGGIALVQATEKLPDTVGGKILNVALKSPLAWIVANSGKKDLDLTKIKENEGYNAKTKKIVNMFDSGIVDSSEVILSAVKNAIGVAATILTTHAIVLLPREDNIKEYIKNLLK